MAGAYAGRAATYRSPVPEDVAGAANGQNARLRRVDDGRKVADAKHAEVADGERAALILVRRQFSVARLSGQLLGEG